MCAPAAVSSLQYFTLIALEQKRRPHSPHTSQPEPRPAPRPPHLSRSRARPGVHFAGKIQVHQLCNFRGTLFFIPGPQVFRPLGQGGTCRFRRRAAAPREAHIAGVKWREFQKNSDLKGVKMYS